MLRHVILILFLIVAAMATGIALVPSEREQWTMLVRDNRNEEALRVLEARYRAGGREADAMLRLYKLEMSFAEVDRATEVLEGLVAARPKDVEAVTLLAKHYSDIENKDGERRTLERLFQLAPSQRTANTLLALYRLDGTYDREEVLLRRLLAMRMISPAGAERLGLMLAAEGDFAGARKALVRFDEIANPERIIGRLALFDLLVRLDEKEIALERAAGWMQHWHKVSLHRPAGTEVPAARLARMMINVDVDEARRLLCGSLPGEVANPRNDSLCALVPVSANPSNLGVAAARDSLDTVGAYGDERTGSEPDR
jgi:tetratricopeptide (TPR) repeat protein